MFILLLSVYLDGKTAEMHVDDYGLTGEDCVIAMIEYDATDPDWSRGVPSCELQKGAITDWILGD